MSRSPLSSREDAAGVWTGHLALIWGGRVSTDASSTAVNSGAAYNPLTRTWAAMPPSPLSPRASVTAYWTGWEAIVIGGVGSSGVTLTDGATYNPLTREWALLPPIPTTARGSAIGLTAAWTGHALIAWSVLEKSSTSEPAPVPTVVQGDMWNPGQTSWRPLPSPPDNVAIVGTTSTWTGGRDVLTGGTFCYGDESCPAPITGSAEVFNPATDTWTIGPSGAIFIRPDLVAATGAGVVLLNENSEITGPDVSLLPGDSVLFSPVPNTVVALPPTPDGDVGPSSSIVWTGRGLLIWGVAGDTTRTFGLELSEK